MLDILIFQTQGAIREKVVHMHGTFSHL